MVMTMNDNMPVVAVWRRLGIGHPCPRARRDALSVPMQWRRGRLRWPGQACATKAANMPQMRHEAAAEALRYVPVVSITPAFLQAVRGP